MTLVSIVVPVFNVEEYLDECVRSLVQQTHEDIEIILVDDGSTDGSAAIIDRLAAEDPSIRIVRQANAGLGAARNAGTDHATGDLLMFVDSDDALPPDAVGLLAQSLEESGSDFATGVVHRFDEIRQWRSGLFRDPFSAYIRETSIVELPGLVYDTIACNKLFRRSFWHDNELRFPIGVLFEDIKVVMDAYSVAVVDVLPQTVYFWRDRGPSGESITQRRSDPSALTDRMNAIDAVAASFRRDGLTGPKAALDRKIATLDLPVYSRHFSGGSEEYRSVFMNRMGTYVEQMEPETRSTLWATEVALCDAVASGEPERVEAVVDALAGRRSLTRVSAAYSGKGLVGRARLQLSAVPAKAAVVTRPARQAMSSIVVRAARGASARLSDLGGATGERFDVPTPLARLNQRMTRRFSTVQRVVRGAPNRTVRGSVRTLPNGRRIMVRYNGEGWPRVRLTGPRVLAEWANTDGHLVVRPVPVGASRMWAVASQTGRQIELEPSDGRFIVPADALTKGTEPSWSIKTELDDRRAIVASPLDAPSAYVRSRDVEVQLNSAPGGDLTLTIERPACAGWLQLSPSGVPMTIHIDVGEMESPEVILCNQRAGLEVAMASESRGTELLACADLLALRKYGRGATLRPGRWDVMAVDGNGTRFRVRLAGPQSEDEFFDYEFLDQPAGASYTYGASDSFLVVSTGNLYRPEERDSVNQRVLASHYSRLVGHIPVSRAVVYECYFGTSAGCHPLALQQELSGMLPADWRHLWVIEPGFQRPPVGTESVVRWSKEYYETMASAALVVTNCDAPPFFRRAPRQTVLQTWHGTPLKKIGFDIERVVFTNTDYLGQLREQSQWWNLLVSPNPLSSGVFPRAFAYDGEMIEVGSPRNDRLVADGAIARDAARTALGLDKATRVVLYAPTWRDTVKAAGGGYKEQLLLDLAQLLRVNPDAVILLRAHANVREVSASVEDGRVLNVSDHPDAQALIAAADVLVTDFSSIMFDFAVTGRPMVFFCPDLETYRDEIRGFYFDFESSAPGPILRRSEDVAVAVRSALTDGITEEYSAPYRAFVDEFLVWEDGCASGRVVDRAIELLRGHGHLDESFEPG